MALGHFGHSVLLGLAVLLLVAWVFEVILGLRSVTVNVTEVVT